MDRDCKEFGRPNSVGIVPVNKLLLIANAYKLESRPNVDGRVPFNEFPPRLTHSSAGIDVPQVSGIDPVKRLSSKKICKVAGEKVNGKGPVSAFC